MYVGSECPTLGSRKSPSNLTYFRLHPAGALDNWNSKPYKLMTNTLVGISQVRSQALCAITFVYVG